MDTREPDAFFAVPIDALEGIIAAATERRKAVHKDWEISRKGPAADRIAECDRTIMAAAEALHALLVEQYKLDRLPEASNAGTRKVNETLVQKNATLTHEKRKLTQKVEELQAIEKQWQQVVQEEVELNAKLGEKIRRLEAAQPSER